MLISILVPVYNVEKYLPQCLRSIDMQSFKDYEVILVDDGSTDSSGRICDDYYQANTENVKVIHQHNQGLLGARITAIQAAEGKYCLCLDSDDYWEPNCLEKLKNLIYLENPDVVIFSSSTISDDTGKKTSMAPVFGEDTVFTDNKGSIYERFICSTDINSIWSKLILTCLMKDSVPEYANMSHKMAGEDLVQCLYPITHARKIVYTTLPLYVYRVRSTSLVASVTETNWIQRSSLPMREFLRKYMDKWGYNEPVWIEKYHCINMLLMTDMFYGILRKTNDYKKTSISLKKLDLSHFIGKEAFQYRHSKNLSLRDQIRIYLILRKRTGVIKVIFGILK